MNKAKVKNNPIVIDNNHKPIVIGHNILGEISRRFPLDKYSQIAVLTDANISKPWTSILQKEIGRKVSEIIVPSGENSKDIKQVENIWKEMFENNLDRHSLLINLGGGVISDLGGFTASTFMRGIDFLNVPTTLLAQIDAGIGGKTAFNFSGSKNLIGTFNQPIGVVIDVQTLSTLPQRELCSGMAEVIKYALTLDKNLLKMILKKKLSKYNQKDFLEIVKRCVINKLNIVQSDEKEQDIRAILNFGHTIAHAIEATSILYNHGEAVAIGMAGAAEISQEKGYLSDKEVNKIKKILRFFNLPIAGQMISPELLWQAMQKDKKKENEEINWVLLKQICQGIIKQKVDKKVIKQVLEKLCH